MITSRLTFLILFGFSFVFLPNCLAGKWRISNTGISAHFTTVQDAANSASVASGDTLYVEGSTVGYGGLYLTKRLVVIGPGYFLGQNPATQANLAPAMIDYLYFNEGSKGAVVTGMTVLASTYLQDSSVTLVRNNLNHVAVTEVSSDNNISQNYIRLLSINGSSGNAVLNNLFTRNDNCGSGNCFYMSNNSSATVRNNIFNGCQVVNGCTYENNIATGTAAHGNDSFTATGSSVLNNVGASTQYGTNNGNQQNVDMSLVFVNSGSDDGRYQLLAGSPASGAGTGGVDCGIFGSSYPYVLSGVPNLPSVWYINIQGSVVTVKALSH